MKQYWSSKLPIFVPNNARICCLALCSSNFMHMQQIASFLRAYLRAYDSENDQIEQNWLITCLNRRFIISFSSEAADWLIERYVCNGWIAVIAFNCKIAIKIAERQIKHAYAQDKRNKWILLLLLKERSKRETAKFIYKRRTKSSHTIVPNCFGCYLRELLEHELFSNALHTLKVKIRLYGLDSLCSRFAND